MAKTTVERVVELMKKPTQIRNICICAHIDHGKTTLSDSLLAQAGMISEELAGQQRFLDFDEQEQARGITINAANVSMVHEVIGKDFLVNLIDTPGHVDFGGDVTRAIRAVDGAIVVACAVEGVMPQTETVLRQVLKDRVKPILFINKVDRLIKELQVTPESMQEKFVAIISHINKLIKQYSSEEYKEKWQVSVQDGSVVFGSAYHKWGLSALSMKEKNISFKDIYESYQSDEEWRNLMNGAPLSETLLTSVVKHLPDPVDAQKYRIPKLWSGDLESEEGKSLLNCDPNGPLMFVVTKVVIDPHAGEIAAGRMFSGTIKKGQEVYLNSLKSKHRVQQVSIYKGDQRIQLEEVPAGNIIGVVGLKGAGSGETVSLEEVSTFESIKHLFEPVVTKAIEAKNPQDLPKLIGVLKDIAKQDPTIAIDINEETGENLISGLGELHLEIWEYRIKHDKKLDIVVSLPIVVYRETVSKTSVQMEGKSPNKHNKLYFIVEPLEKGVQDAIKAGDIPEMRLKKRKPEIEALLVKAGMDKDEARKVRAIRKNSVLIDATRGIVHIGEIIEMIMEAFNEITKSGPVAREPTYGLKVKLMDAKLHEDSIHRGPGQIIPATREGVYGAMLSAGAEIYEPIQTIRIDAPVDCLGPISKLVQGRRGQLLDTAQEDGALVMQAKLPVSEMFGFTSDLRSATHGRGAWFLVDQMFEKLPSELQEQTILKIRDRKGLPKVIPKPQVE